MKICKDCGKEGDKGFAKGLCPACYMRNRRKNMNVGQQDAYQMVADDARRVFAIENRARWVGECREYLGTRNSGDYGVYHAYERTLLVHRIIAIHHGKATPDDEAVRHSCDNPWCIYEGHLEGGTHKQNSQDKVERGRNKHLCVGCVDPFGNEYRTVQEAAKAHSKHEQTVYRWVRFRKYGWRPLEDENGEPKRVRTGRRPKLIEGPDGAIWTATEAEKAKAYIGRYGACMTASTLNKLAAAGKDGFRYRV